MKLAIGQIGSYVSVYDGRATTNYTQEEFADLVHALNSARELIKDPLPSAQSYHILFHNEEYEQWRKPPKVEKSIGDLDEILKDLFEGE